MQCNAMQCNAMQCNAMQCNAMQCNEAASKMPCIPPKHTRTFGQPRKQGVGHPHSVNARRSIYHHPPHTARSAAATNSTTSSQLPGCRCRNSRTVRDYPCGPPASAIPRRKAATARRVCPAPPPGERPPYPLRKEGDYLPRISTTVTAVRVSRHADRCPVASRLRAACKVLRM